jgi:hypothetical protein
MVDRTVVRRVKNQRDARLLEGWQEVRVWVPSEKDANDIRNIAAERRAKAEALDGLSKEVPKVSPQTEARIAQAIAQHGSTAYTTPSGAVLDLITKLADEDNLQGFSRAVVILARAKPANARFVIESVPAKISNFIIRRRDVTAGDLMKWADANPQWPDELKRSVRDPKQFERVVEAMAKSIKDFAKQGCVQSR